MPAIEEQRLVGKSRAALLGTLAYVGAIASGLLAAASIARFFAAHIGHDQAWGLYLATQVLGGVKLNGPALVEVNPPFIVWFMALPVLLGRLFHIPSIDAFRCFFVLLAALGIIWSTSLFQRLYRPSAFVLWSVVGMECALLGLLIDIDNFGQREHMAAYLLLPYLVAAAFRLRNETLAPFESALIGFSAAVAICLKPQHALELFLVEALVLMRVRSLNRWFHPALLVLMIGGIAYIVVIRWAAPSYFTDVVPLLKDTYWGFNEAYRLVLLYAAPLLKLLTLNILLYTLLRRRLCYEALEAVLLAAATGALIAYVQQHKGWSYQQIPFRCFVWILLTLLLADLMQMALARSENPAGGIGRWRVVAAIASLGIGLVVWPHFIRPMNYAEPEKQTIATLLNAYPPGTAMTFLSKNPWEFPALLEQQKVLGTRYMHLWLLPAIIRSLDPYDGAAKLHLPAADVERLSSLLRSNEAQDLAHFRPAVVVVDRCAVKQFCDPAQHGRFGGVVDWFLIDPAFRREWANYKLQKTENDLEVYRRMPS